MCERNSFLAHPQIKPTHANKESKKLTSHETSGTASNGVSVGVITNKPVSVMSSTNGPAY